MVGKVQFLSYLHEMFPAGFLGLFEDDTPAERRAAEDVLEKLFAAAEADPPAGLLQGLLGKLDFPCAKLTLQDLPPVNRFSNHLDWIEVVRQFLPVQPVKELFMHPLRHDEKLMQILVISGTDIPEEVHDDYIESFFILKGACSCKVGDRITRLFPGDFLSVPSHVSHTVELLSPTVTAILQYEFLSRGVDNI